MPANAQTDAPQNTTDDQLDVSAPQPAPEAPQPILSAREIRQAIRHGKRRHKDKLWIRRYQEAVEAPRTGRWNETTVVKIAKFQKRVMGKKPTGKVGPKTRIRLRKHLRASHGWKKGYVLTRAERKAAQKHNRSVNTPRAWIRKFKKLLKIKKGGRGTFSFIERTARFQRRNKLSLNGKLTRGTRQKLRAAYKKKYANPMKVHHENTASANGKITGNFSWGEFHCNDGTKVPKHLRGNVIKLARQLEVIKKYSKNASVRINSGYRSPSYNAAIGGASNSMHVQGKAADIVVSGYRPSQTQSLIRSLMSRGKLTKGGLGIYGTFTHYDIGAHRTWYG